MIAGVDEVGRGALAGPLVVAVVTLDTEDSLDGITDSKQLTLKQRLEYCGIIQAKASGIGLGWAAPHIIDGLGLTNSLKYAAKQAFRDLTDKPSTVVVDGNLDFSPSEYIAVTKIKADQSVLAVACASVIAKVYRDNYMKNIAEQYPDFGFETNVGYGTRQHRQALANIEPTPIHRHSFKPISQPRFNFLES